MNKNASKGFIHNLFSSILWAIIIALFVRTLFFEAYRIPSGSMIPTLRVGDYLFVSKYPYGYSRYSIPFGPPLFYGRIFFSMPKRGDIIVFKGVNDPHEYYIKRLIGLPGDKIRLINGNIFINNEKVEVQDDGTFTMTDSVGAKRIFNKATETIDGKSYDILQPDIQKRFSFPHTTMEYQVPAGHFFFMGDNRDNSVDSRFLDNMSFIPADRLVGRADYLVFSGEISIKNLFSDNRRSFTLIK